MTSRAMSARPCHVALHGWEPHRREEQRVPGVRGESADSRQQLRGALLRERAGGSAGGVVGP